MSEGKISQHNRIIVIAFLLSFVYWIYLLITAKMNVAMDAVSYEHIGKVLYQQGWVEFFKGGPGREPLYPLIISISMRLADVLSVSYTKVQIVIQFLILLATQLLTLNILKKCNVSSRVSALIVLYMGFSPSLVNSALSLFSEIGTYPIVLGIVIIAVKSWRAIFEQSKMRMVQLGITLGILFILVILMKAIFEYVQFLFLLPFIWLFIKSVIVKNQKVIVNTIVFLICVLLTVNSFTYMYKSLNLKYNGQFQMTDRGAWMLYGSVAKRMEPLSKKEFMAYVASIPGQGVCLALFDQDTCYRWTSRYDSTVASKETNRFVRDKVPKDQMNSLHIENSKKLIFKDPLRYVGFMFLESFKMFFWESTQIGFVWYPGWLSRLFEFTIFKNGLRLGVFCVTFFSVLFAVFSTLHYRRDLYDVTSTESEKHQYSFFILLMIFSLSGFYSLVHILTRFSLPLAALFLVLIADVLSRWMDPKQLRNKNVS